MKTLFFSLALFCAASFVSPLMAQENKTDDSTNVTKVEGGDSSSIAAGDSSSSDSANIDSVVAEEKIPLSEPPVEEQAPKEEVTLHQTIKTKFIEGGVEFMGVVLICLILGLAIAIERIITLNLASTNINKLLKDVRSALQSGGVEFAKDVCAKTSGPIGSIFVQGLHRAGEGVESVEKAIIQNGGVEMGKLEKGLTWISLFISLAPMLGFMGTVIGMIDAFDTIQQAADIEIDQVAGGIKVALLTTVAGLIVAVILQVFYNYCVSKIDSIVNQMEEASILLVDTLIEYEIVKNKK